MPNSWAGSLVERYRFDQTAGARETARRDSPGLSNAPGAGLAPGVAA